MSAKQFLFGIHAIVMLLEKQPERIIRLSVLTDRQDKKLQSLVRLAKQHEIGIDFLTRKELDKLTQGENHQGVVAHCVKAKRFDEEDLGEFLESKNHPLLLILDGVQDPHNLGACFRTADAAGVDVIIAPKDKSVGLTPIVSKVASGAAETVPFVQVTNLARTMNMIKQKGIWLYGAEGEAEQSIYQMNFTGPAAIVMGAEGEGLRRLTRENCDYLFKIPMLGSVSSLNVSVATGVALFEVVRQRFVIKK